MQANRIGFAAGNYSALRGENYINADGDLAVVGGTTAGVTQVLVMDPPGALMSVADTLTFGLSHIDFIGPYLSANGLSVIFIGTGQGTAVRGIYRVANSQVFPIVQTTDGFTDFNDFAMNADGALLAFTAVTLDGRTGIFMGSNPVLDQLIVTGSAIPFARLAGRLTACR